jgi:predicted RND superfamily exporter protein
MSEQSPSGKLPHEEPLNPYFLGLAGLVTRYRWVVLALSVAITALSGWAIATRLTVDTSVESFAATHSESQQVLEEYRDDFGRDDMFLVLIEGDVFSLPYLERLRALHDELAKLDVKVETLGERRADRDVKRHRAPAAPKPAAAPAEPAPTEEALDDAFADFGGDDGFGDDADGGDAFDAWEGVEGGTIVDEITSLVNVRQTRGTPEGIEVGELLDPFPTTADLPAMKAKVLGDATLVGQVVGKAGRHSVIVLRTQFMAEADTVKVYHAIEDVVAKHQAEGFDIRLSGMPALNVGLNNLMMTDLSRMLVLSVGAMFLMLLFLFRHPIGVLGPLIVVAMAAINTLGMMAIVGMPLTMLSNILPAFLACVGIGDSVHLLSVYRDEMRRGVDPGPALIKAVATTGVPVFYTSITTMVGLLSFQFASLTAIQEMGLAGAFGVLVAMALSLTFLPALVTFNKGLMGAKAEGRHDRLDHFLALCLRASGVDDDDGRGPTPPLALRRRRRTLLAGAALVGFALFGMSLLRVYHNPLTWMPDGTPVKTDIEMLDTHIGGTANVQLLIDGPPGRGLKDQALLLGLEKLQAHIAAYEHPEVGPIVGNAISVLDVLHETNRALHGGDPAFDRLPDTQRAIGDALFMFENAGPDELRKLATNDLQRGQMSIRIKWLDATSYLPLAEHVDAGIQKYVPADASVRPTGSIYTLVTTVSNLLSDLIRSFGMAFVVITLVMMLLLRNIKLGLIAMVPNLMPIAFIMGLMGGLGIPIDMNNLLIASIAIGIAVDDTIHFMHHYRVNHDWTGNVEHALTRAMRHSGRAMASTTLILMVGFFVYLGASMYNIQRFGLLIGLTALMALLIDLVFAPALIRAAFRRRPPKPQESAA